MCAMLRIIKLLHEQLTASKPPTTVAPSFQSLPSLVGRGLRSSDIESFPLSRKQPALMSREDDGGKAAPARQRAAAGYPKHPAHSQQLCRARAFLADSGSIGSCGAVRQGGSGNADTSGLRRCSQAVMFQARRGLCEVAQVISTALLAL